MRLAARTDSNQTEVVKQFRKFGCSVAITSSLGHGFPDIIVGKNFKNILVEIKDGNKTESARKLTSDEVDFAADWKGLICIVENLSDVIAVVKALEK
jgi:Holliday junction resolvase